jgi:hypothetical protein
MRIAHSYTVIVIVGLIILLPPQHPIPPVDPEKLAYIGTHAADASVSKNPMHGIPINWI